MVDTLCATCACRPVCICEDQDIPTIDCMYYVKKIIYCRNCVHCIDRGKYLRCVVNGFVNGKETSPDGFCHHGENRTVN